MRPLILLGLLLAWAYAATPLPLLGVLSFLARQGGYGLDLPALHPDLVRPVPIDLEAYRGLPREALPQVLASLVGEATEGRFTLEAQGEVLRLVPAQPPRPKTSVASGPTYRLLFLYPDGEVAELPDPFPREVSSVVQERLPRGEKASLVLDLSPLEITCLEMARQAVCLRPLFLQGEGQLEVELGGKRLLIKYRVQPPPPALRRISLDGTYAPIPLSPRWGSPFPR